MNEKINYGGPAYPFVVDSMASEGLTIRDVLASKAIPALIERHEISWEAELRITSPGQEPMENPACTLGIWDEVESWKTVAEGAYALADAMILARSKNSKHATNPSGN